MTRNFFDLSQGGKGPKVLGLVQNGQKQFLTSDTHLPMDTSPKISSLVRKNVGTGGTGSGFLTCLKSFRLDPPGRCPSVRTNAEQHHFLVSAHSVSSVRSCPQKIIAKFRKVLLQRGCERRRFDGQLYVLCENFVAQAK